MQEVIKANNKSLHDDKTSAQGVGEDALAQCATALQTPAGPASDGLLSRWVGEEMLQRIARDHLDLLETSSAIYEKDGSCALAIFRSGWCQTLNCASQDCCEDEGPCQRSCWNDALRVSMERRTAVDIECRGGIRVYALPIPACDEVVGSICFGYGDPPRERQKIEEIARRYGLDAEQLEEQTRSYESRPQSIIEIAKRRLATSARLIGEIAERKRTERALRRQNERQRLLAEAAAHLLCTATAERMVSDVFAKISGHLEAHAYFNFMVEESGKGLRMDSCAGIPPEAVESIRHLDFGQAVCGAVALRRSAMVVSHIQESADPLVQLIKSFGIRAYACNPLMVGNRLLGTLSFASRTRDSFDVEELEFLRTICNYVAIAKERLRLLGELNERASRLAQSESHLGLAIETAKLGTWEHNLLTLKLTCSERWRAIFGFSADEIVTYDRVIEKAHPCDRPRLEEAFRQLLSPEGSGETEIEYRIVRSDLGVRWIQARARAFFGKIDGQNRAVSCMGTTLDITERKHAEQEVRRVNEQLAAARDAAIAASRAKSAFLANMSHELRTPLNGIIGYSEMLREDAQEQGQDSFASDLERIQQAGKHLLGLISEILDLSRVEAGRVNVNPETFCVSELIEQAALTVRPLLEKNGNHLELALDEEVGLMYSDPLKVRQILLNLLGNAAKFTEVGTVRVEASREIQEQKPWLWLRVMDTGIGMSGEQVAGLFEKFHQADSTITRKYGGSGLGLAISKAYCEILGGIISVRSEPQKGSVFTVRLPMEIPPAETAAESNRSTAYLQIE